jgi:hypothetical protein
MQHETCERCNGQLILTETTEDRDLVCLQCSHRQPASRPDGSRYQETMLIELAAHIVQDGLQSYGPQYAIDEDGAFWLSLLNLVPEEVAEIAIARGLKDHGDPACGLETTFYLNPAWERSAMRYEHRIMCGICNRSISVFLRSETPSAAELAEAGNRLVKWHSSDTGLLAAKYEHAKQLAMFAE